MKKINEILFIVHPGFDSAEQIELESNIKSKIDELSEGIKKGVNSVLVFVDEPGIDVYELENKNNIELHYQIFDYLTFINCGSVVRKIFARINDIKTLNEITEEGIKEKFDEDLVNDLNMLLEEEIKELSKKEKDSEEIYRDFFIQYDNIISNEIYLEAFNILRSEYTKKGKILIKEFKEYKINQFGTISSKLPANINRKARLYQYAVEKLGEDKVIQTFMDDGEGNNIKSYLNRKSTKITNDYLSKIDEHIMFNFSRRFYSLKEMIKDNIGLELNIGGEYLGRCVDNFTYLLLKDFVKNPENGDKFIDKKISLIKKGDENKIKKD